jgi:hypothetical protein
MYLPNTDTMAGLAKLAPRYIYRYVALEDYTDGKAMETNLCLNCTTTWSRWGRWVLAGILLFFGFLVLLFLLYVSPIPSL